MATTTKPTTCANSACEDKPVWKVQPARPATISEENWDGRGFGYCDRHMNAVGGPSHVRKTGAKVTKIRDTKAEYQRRMERTGGTYNTSRRNPMKGTPTGDTYQAFQVAYATMNRELFGGELPNCLITLRTFGKARAYFSPDRFVDITAMATTHEIAMDPRQFMDRTTVEILSTLAHEMCHLWQREHGSPSRNGYHNAEWGSKMKEVGLHPSNTGEPGGKETGQQMTHYIVEDGPFEKVALELVGSGQFKATWADIVGFLTADPDKIDPKVATLVAPRVAKAPKSTKAGKRVKYVCPVCANAVWGRPGLRVACAGTEAEGQDPAPHDPMAMFA